MLFLNFLFTLHFTLQSRSIKKDSKTLILAFFQILTYCAIPSPFFSPQKTKEDLTFLHILGGQTLFRETVLCHILSNKKRNKEFKLNLLLFSLTSM